MLLQLPLSAEEQLQQDQAPEKLGIGGDSGFQVDRPAYNIDKRSELILLGSNIKVPLPCPQLPEYVINAIQVRCIQCSVMSAASSCDTSQYFPECMAALDYRQTLA